MRLEQLKVLAARADQRWAAKESYLDQPEGRKVLGEVEAPSGTRGVGDVAAMDESNTTASTPETSETENKSRVKDRPEKKDPWKVARGGPSEEWQPAAWGGEVAPRKR